MKRKTVAFNFQVDPEQIAKARAVIDLPETLRQVVASITKTSKCPCCGNHLKGSKKK